MDVIIRKTGYQGQATSGESTSVYFTIYPKGYSIKKALVARQLIENLEKRDYIEFFNNRLAQMEKKYF